MSFLSKGTAWEAGRTQDVVITGVVATAFALGTAGLVWIVVVIRCGLAGSVWP